jgi:hypothetical protein
VNSIRVVDLLHVRVIGERSDAVFRTAVPGGDEEGPSLPANGSGPKWPSSRSNPEGRGTSLVYYHNVMVGAEATAQPNARAVMVAHCAVRHNGSVEEPILILR